MPKEHMCAYCLHVGGAHEEPISRDNVRRSALSARNARPCVIAGCDCPDFEGISDGH